MPAQKLPRKDVEKLKRMVEADSYIAVGKVHDALSIMHKNFGINDVETMENILYPKKDRLEKLKTYIDFKLDSEDE